jgi:homoserine kinase
MAHARTAEAFAPATMGNVGIGFDILGLAYTGLGDRILAEFAPGRGAWLARITGDGGVLPLESERNVATIAAQAVLDHLGVRDGVALTLQKGLPLASGLGSSAASSVAAAVAVNALLGEPLTRRALLPMCLAGEAAVSGAHADNVAPALLGGIVLITGTTAQSLLPLPVPAGLVFGLVTPDIAVPTAQARAVLPPQITLGAMVQQTAQVACLIRALYENDLRAVGRAMEGDVVVEPARKQLIPHFDDARQLAKAEGAIALVISGAGPTLAAICEDEATAATVVDALRAHYLANGLRSLTQVSRIDTTGARVHP